VYAAVCATWVQWFAKATKHSTDLRAGAKLISAAYLIYEMPTAERPSTVQNKQEIYSLANPLWGLHTYKRCPSF